MKTMDDFRKEWYDKHDHSFGSEQVFEWCVEQNSNNLQKLKDELLKYADEGIELCFGSVCDERIPAMFEKIIEKLSAV
jgi:hypothetical protein